MDRRDALRLTSALFGGVVFGGELFLSGCSQKQDKAALFSASDVALMDEIGETILPHSDRSPGAKAAAVGIFMVTIVQDCYGAQEAADFTAGLKEINKAAKKNYSTDFTRLNDDQKAAVLTAFDKAARASEEGAPHFYNMIKQLVIWGYFSSEIGHTQALRYDPVPGGYNGDVVYHAGDRAWVGPVSSID